MTMRFLLAAGPLALLCAGCSSPAEDPAPAQGEAAAPAAASPVNAADPAATPRPAQPGEIDSGIPPLTAAGFAGYIVGRPIPLAGPAPAVVDRIDPDCRMYRDPNLPGVWIMTDGDAVVQRVAVVAPSTLETGAGIGLGASEAAVRAAYPGIRREASETAVAPGGVLYTAPADEAGLRFDIGKDGRVAEMSGGAQPFLAYSEGCA